MVWLFQLPKALYGKAWLTADSAVVLLERSGIFRKRVFQKNAGQWHHALKEDVGTQSLSFFVSFCLLLLFPSFFPLSLCLCLWPPLCTTRWTAFSARYSVPWSSRHRSKGSKVSSQGLILLIPWDKINIHSRKVNFLRYFIVVTESQPKQQGDLDVTIAEPHSTDLVLSNPLLARDLLKV